MKIFFLFSWLFLVFNLFSQDKGYDLASDKFYWPCIKVALKNQDTDEFLNKEASAIIQVIWSKVDLIRYSDEDAARLRYLWGEEYTPRVTGPLRYIKPEDYLSDKSSDFNRMYTRYFKTIADQIVFYEDKWTLFTIYENPEITDLECVLYANYELIIKVNGYEQQSVGGIFKAGSFMNHEIYLKPAINQDQPQANLNKSNNILTELGIMNSDELSKKSGIKKAKIEEAINDSKLKGKKIGVRYFIRLKDFDEYLANKTKTKKKK